MNLLSFNGRSNRLQFFLISLAPFVLGIITVMLVMAAGVADTVVSSGDGQSVMADASSAIANHQSFSYSSDTVTAHASFSSHPLSAGVGIVLFLAGLAVTWLWLAAQVRRFHDLAASGWFVLFNLIPGASFFIWLVLQIAPGQQGVNAYGPPPR